MKTSLQGAKLVLQRRNQILRSLSASKAMSSLNGTSKRTNEWGSTRDEVLRSIEEVSHIHTFTVGDISKQGRSNLIYMHCESQDKNKLDDIAYSLAFATQQGSKFPALTKPADLRMQEQLRRSKNQLRVNLVSEPDVEPLPRTFEDAVRPTRRAIIVTEATPPFKVVNVNKAWEGLCGYTFAESKGNFLGELLNGPETDTCAATALVNQLMNGEEAGTVLTNYTKSGRRFRNRLRVGPLVDESGRTSHFVGVLQEC
jgi:PAS domain S-box-containing protein